MTLGRDGKADWCKFLKAHAIFDSNAKVINECLDKDFMCFAIQTFECCTDIWQQPLSLPALHECATTPGDLKGLDGKTALEKASPWKDGMACFGKGNLNALEKASPVSSTSWCFGKGSPRQPAFGNTAALEKAPHSSLLENSF